MIEQSPSAILYKYPKKFRYTHRKKRNSWYPGMCKRQGMTLGAAMLT
jgi:hypothetical protein